MGLTENDYKSYWLVPGDELKQIRDIMQPVYEQSVDARRARKELKLRYGG